MSINRKTKIFFFLSFSLWIAAAVLLLRVNRNSAKTTVSHNNPSTTASSSVAGLFTSASAQNLTDPSTSTPEATTAPAEVSPAQPDEVKIPAPKPAPPPPEPVTQEPVSLRIPAIKLLAPIVKTGLETDGSLHVPSSPDQTGWYDLGPKPGDIGPAVITGHLDSAAGPGVFYNLKNVKSGDEIDVIRDDGSTAVFTVDKLARYPQDDFNTQAVYGSINTAGLRIITCSGIYSRTTKHYSDDLVVYATLSKIIQPGAYQPLN